MLLARVEGNAISTIHHPTLKGWRQLLCQPVNESGASVGDPILAMDDLGSGMGQVVLITSDGKTVRERVGTPLTPLRYLIIGILDNDGKDGPL